MISFDEAVTIVTAAARPLGSERVALALAGNRVLSEPVLARVDSPPADVSAMDGYAVLESDLESFPVRLRIVGKSFAGAANGIRVESGCCVRIFTGAPLPVGADRVVIQEVVNEEDATAVIDRHPGPSRHVRRRASDFAEGDVLLTAGRRLGYREMVAAAGGDQADLSVWRQPRLFVISTGDELVAPGAARGNATAIPESVSYGVTALAESWGGRLVGHLRLADDLPEMQRAALAAADAADLVVVTGGASVGEKDLAKQMFAPLDLLFSKVAIKPGKPVWLGRSGGVLVMGFPGNPTSALVTARLLLAPLVAGLSGLDPRSALDWREVSLAAPLGPCGDRETFVRARSEAASAEPVANQDSSAQKTLADADLLLRRRALSGPSAAGDRVEILSF